MLHFRVSIKFKYVATLTNAVQKKKNFFYLFPVLIKINCVTRWSNELHN